MTARTPVTGTPGTDTGTDTDTDTDAGTDEEPSVAQLDPVPRLARLSLDLRGVRPSLEEIASVEADESMLETYAERWVQQDPFLDRGLDVERRTPHRSGAACSTGLDALL